MYDAGLKPISKERLALNTPSRQRAMLRVKLVNASPWNDCYEANQKHVDQTPSRSNQHTLRRTRNVSTHPVRTIRMRAVTSGPSCIARGSQRLWVSRVTARMQTALTRCISTKSVPRKYGFTNVHTDFDHSHRVVYAKTPRTLEV